MSTTMRILSVAVLLLASTATAQTIEGLHVPTLAGFRCENRVESTSTGSTAFISCIRRGRRELTQLMLKEYSVGPEWVRDADDLADNTYIPQWTGVLRGARVRQGWIAGSSPRTYELEVRGRHDEHGPMRAYERVATQGNHVFVWTLLTNRPTSRAVVAAERRWFAEARFDNL